MTAAFKASRRDSTVPPRVTLYTPASSVLIFPFCTGADHVHNHPDGRASGQGDAGRRRDPLGTAGEPGAELTLDQVLLVEKDGGEVLAGAPFVANARVIAVVDGETRGPKIRVFKKKRRKGMRRTKGHRAVYTQVRIKDILL